MKSHILLRFLAVVFAAILCAAAGLAPSSPPDICDLEVRYVSQLEWRCPEPEEALCSLPTLCYQGADDTIFEGHSLVFCLCDWGPNPTTFFCTESGPKCRTVIAIDSATPTLKTPLCFDCTCGVLSGLEEEDDDCKKDAIPSAYATICTCGS